MAEMKPLPIGVEDFKELIEKEYYFVDKTLMIASGTVSGDFGFAEKYEASDI